MPLSASVTVPATTANIGPGFDCLGAALSLYNTFDFQVLGTSDSAVIISAEGEEADAVSTEPDNLVYQSFLHLFQHLNQTPPPIQIKIHLNVPLSRGLGSSATAIIGGLMGANAIAQRPLTRAQILDLAIALEGHPDNVAPALIGGCQLSTIGGQGKTICCPVEWASDVVPVVAIPDFELSTQEARDVLPGHCSYSEAVFNASHLGLLIKGFESGRVDWLQTALNDQLHQPYRATLIRGYEEIQKAAIAAGAYGLVISGAGPTLLALCASENTSNVVSAMTTTWTSHDVNPKVLPLSLDHQGTQVTVQEM